MSNWPNSKAKLKNHDILFITVLIGKRKDTILGPKMGYNSKLETNGFHQS